MSDGQALTQQRYASWYCGWNTLKGCTEAKELWVDYRNVKYNLTTWGDHVNMLLL